MNIRKATPEDKPELCRLLLEFDLATQEELSDRQARMRAHRDPKRYAQDKSDKILSQPNYVVFVAEAGGGLVGYVSGELKDKENRIYDREGYIENWYVSKELRGQAVGKTLFGKIVEYFTEAGCTHLALDTHLENETAARIYEHMGFDKRLVTFFKLLK